MNTTGSGGCTAKTRAELLFTNNETNLQRLYGVENTTPYVKDGINNYIVQGMQGTVNPRQHRHQGRRALSGHRWRGRDSRPLQLRFSNVAPNGADPFDEEFERIFSARQQEADEFYATVTPEGLSADARNVMRQAFAGLLWSKQFYHYDVNRWLRGDPMEPPPRPSGCMDGTAIGPIYTMPMSFPCRISGSIPGMRRGTSLFTASPWRSSTRTSRKNSSFLMLREWYMHPNGQIPGLRMGVGRRQSAGPCVGGLAGI